MKYQIFMFFYLVLQIAGQQKVYACKCPSRSIAERYAQSRFVFSAVLKAEQKVCATDTTWSAFKVLDNCNNQIGARIKQAGRYTVFTVTKVWKGQLPKEIAIFQNSTGCDYSFGYHPYYDRRPPPQEFIIFAGEWKNKHYTGFIPPHSIVLSTTLCSGNLFYSSQVSKTLDSLSDLANIMFSVVPILENQELVLQIAIPAPNQPTVELSDGITMQVIPIRWWWETKATLEVRVKYEYLRNRLFTIRIQHENGYYFYPFMYQEPYTYFPAKPRFYLQ